MQQNSLKNIRNRKLLHTEAEKNQFFHPFFVDYFFAWTFLQRGRGVITRVRYSTAAHHSTNHRPSTSLLQLGRAGGRVGPVLNTASCLCGNNSNKNRGTRVYLLVSIQIGQFIYRDVFWEFMNVRGSTGPSFRQNQAPEPHPPPPPPSKENPLQGRDQGKFMRRKK